MFSMGRKWEDEPDRNTRVGKGEAREVESGRTSECSGTSAPARLLSYPRRICLVLKGSRFSTTAALRLAPHFPEFINVLLEMG